jgi:choline dehydrogenase
MPNIKSEYDYIIVGAGTAGCVVAAELVRREAGSVLLVEEGARASHRFSRTPVLYPHLFSDARFCYNYETVPQPGLAGRKIRLPAGKGIGGSTLVNAMIYMPPHRGDLENWQKIAGEDWTWAQCQSALQQVDTNYPDRERKVADLHDVSQAFLRLTQRNDASNDLFPYERTTRNGFRFDAKHAWLKHISSSKVSIVRDVRVKRIRMKLDSAEGIECSTTDSSHEFIRCVKGVIVCCGAFGSPQLLANSGFGRNVARGSQETMIHESMMLGENLQDHLVFPIVLESPCHPLQSRFSRMERCDYLSKRTGPMASNIAELGAFLRPNANGENSNSCLEFCEIDRSNGPMPTVQWHVTPTHYLEYPMRDVPSPCMSIAVTHLHPKSRGRMRLIAEECTQTRLNGGSLIDPDYHAMAEDRDALVTAIQWARAWIANHATEHWTAREVMPGDRRTSDEQVRRMVERLATTIYHFVGTCAIGVDDDAVCTPRFRVRGSDNLFVCDGSSIPLIPSGNTQVTVMMMAIRLAEWLADS